jgi:hypothetical protein
MLFLNMVCLTVASVKSPSFEASTDPRKKEELWSDKHAPTGADQLSVHPKKVQEVKQWFNSYFSFGGCVVAPFLLLTGPSGCGKSSTGEFHDQADAKWMVIRGPLRGHSDTPCRQPTPGRKIGRP